MDRHSRQILVSVVSEWPQARVVTTRLAFFASVWARRHEKVNVRGIQRPSWRREETGEVLVPYGAGKRGRGIVTIEQVEREPKPDDMLHARGDDLAAEPAGKPVGRRDH
jgi:hypothetical protein